MIKKVAEKGAEIAKDEAKGFLVDVVSSVITKLILILIGFGIVIFFGYKLLDIVERKIDGATTAVVNEVKEQKEAVVNGVVAVKDVTVKAISSVGDSASRAIGKTEEKVGEVTTSVSETANNTVNSVKDISVDVKDSTTKTVIEIKEKTSSVYTNLKEKALSKMNSSESLDNAIEDRLNEKPNTKEEVLEAEKSSFLKLKGYFNKD